MKLIREELVTGTYLAATFANVANLLWKIKPKSRIEFALGDKVCRYYEIFKSVNNLET